MRTLVLDTNILIYISKGDVDRHLIAAHYDVILVSVVSQVEALGYAFTAAEEETTLLNLLAGMHVLPFTKAEAQHAIAYRKQARKIKFPDAAILATARAAGADLLTQNTADFRGLDPAVRVLRIQEL